MTTAETIRSILVEALLPTSVEVIDESHLHAGHGGWTPSGESHFRVRIVASAFNGRSRLDRHRLINTLLTRQLAEGVHALAIEARGSEESR